MRLLPLYASSNYANSLGQFLAPCEFHQFINIHRTLFDSLGSSVTGVISTETQIPSRLGSVSYLTILLSPYQQGTLISRKQKWLFFLNNICIGDKHLGTSRNVEP